MRKLNALTFLTLLSVVASPELSADVIVVQSEPYKHGSPVLAIVGSSRLAEKLGRKVGEVFLKGKAVDVVKGVIEALGGGGTVLFKRGSYNVGELVLPVPSCFTFVGEQRRFWTARLHGVIKFEKTEDKKALRHTFLILRNLEVSAPRGARSAIRCPAGNVVFEGVFTTHAYRWEGGSHIVLTGPDWGVKILEHPVWMGAVKGICWDLRPKFVSVIDPEAWVALNGIKFGGGGLYVGGHLAVPPGPKEWKAPWLVGISTYPLETRERKFYPVTVIGGAPEGPSVAYEADGAFLILLGCSLGHNAKIMEKNGGKVVKVGNE